MSCFEFTGPTLNLLAGGSEKNLGPAHFVQNSQKLVKSLIPWLVLKEHVALDRSSWSLKYICNRLL